MSEQGNAKWQFVSMGTRRFTQFEPFHQSFCVKPLYLSSVGPDVISGLDPELRRPKLFQLANWSVAARDLLPS